VAVPGPAYNAYQLLTLIYAWFTEGFNTADLQEAKVLLEVLSCCGTHAAGCHQRTHRAVKLGNCSGGKYLDPGDIWMVAVEVTRNRFDQNREGGLTPQATRLPHRKDPLHPAVAFSIVGPLHHLAP
jgi:hypothetical protein